jgi:hypothetical protein
MKLVCRSYLYWRSHAYYYLNHSQTPPEHYKRSGRGRFLVGTGARLGTRPDLQTVGGGVFLERRICEGSAVGARLGAVRSRGEGRYLRGGSRRNIRGSVGGMVLERRRRPSSPACVALSSPAAQQKREGVDAFYFHPSPTGFGGFSRA